MVKGTSTEEQAVSNAASASTREATRDGSTPLFPGTELETLRTRWKEIQTAFVDEPQRAVEQADGLLASAMKRLAEVFAEERSRLEKQGIEGIAYRPKTCAWRYSAIGRFLIGCWRYSQAPAVARALRLAQGGGADEGVRPSTFRRILRDRVRKRTFCGGAGLLRGLPLLQSRRSG